MYAKVFSAFFLIVTIAHVHCEETGLSPEVEKCFERSNVTEEYLKSVKIENLSKKDKSKVICALGCLLKGQIAKDGKTIYQYFLESLKDGDIKVNVNALTQGLNSCSNVGDDECKFIECLEKTGQEWKNRIEDWVTYFISTN